MSRKISHNEVRFDLFLKLFFSDFAPLPLIFVSILIPASFNWSSVLFFELTDRARQHSTTCGPAYQLSYILHKERANKVRIRGQLQTNALKEDSVLNVPRDCS